VKTVAAMFSTRVYTELKIRNDVSGEHLMLLHTHQTKVLMIHIKGENKATAKEMHAVPEGCSSVPCCTHPDAWKTTLDYCHCA
jgi:hypothetical protein